MKESVEKLKDEFNLCDTFKTEKILLLITGVYPLRNKKINLLHYFSLIISYSITFFGLISILIGVLNYFDNLASVADSMAYGMTHGAMVLKLTLLLMHRKQLLVIEDELQNYLFYQHSEEDRTTLKATLKTSQIFGSVFRSMCTTSITFYHIFPFLDGTRLIPTNAWFPWKIEDYRITSFIFQSACIIYSAVINSSIDIISCKLITIICGEIAILKNNLSKLDYTQSYEDVNKTLKDNVKIYAGLKRLHLLNFNLFSKGVLVQLLVTISVICFTLFTFLTIKEINSQVLFLGFYLIAMVTQVTIYCWYGHFIMDESNGITMACYMSNWNISDLRARKTLRFIMTCTQSPIVFQAGGMVPLSIATLIALMKHSYSFFTVLKRIYKE